MIKVRCPRCQTIAQGPPEAFACAGCGARLRWYPPSAFTSQLTLDLGGWEQPELPVMQRQRPRSPAGASGPPPPAQAGAGSLDPTAAAHIAISLVTAAMAAGDGADEVHVASLDLLFGLSRDELMLLAITSAQLTSSIFTSLDAQQPGTGTSWLQAFALAFSEEPAPPDRS